MHPFRVGFNQSEQAIVSTILTLDMFVTIRISNKRATCESSCRPILPALRVLRTCAVHQQEEDSREGTLTGSAESQLLYPTATILKHKQILYALRLKLPPVSEAPSALLNLDANMSMQAYL